MTEEKERRVTSPEDAHPDIVEQIESGKEDSELHAIEQESKKQELPEQEQVFSIAKRVKSRLTHLPDPAHPPLGFVPGRGFDVVFPFIRLPELKPTLNGDWVQFGTPELEPNLLYWGDNLQVLRTLPSESIDLIYIDPPFFSGEQYNVIWGDANEVRTFNDIWDGGLDTYLIWLNARLWEMKRVLKSTGSIFVHCDWHASHYIKVEMDNIFGYNNMCNEIVWHYSGWNRKLSHEFSKRHDVLLFYRKSNNHHFYSYARPWKSEEEYVRKRKQKVRIDSNGRKYVLSDAGGGKRIFRYLEDAIAEGAYVDDVWDLDKLNNSEKEAIGYPTQKPVRLLEGVILSATKKNDIVADFFCGGGSTLALAQRLGRRWIGCDISRVAVSVTLDRMVKICEEQSGVMSNYGRPDQIQFQESLDFVKERVPDIRMVYVGVYPMDRFKSVDQSAFEKFVLQCYDARLDTSDQPITGWRGALEPVLVGPADPDRAPDPKQVRVFFKSCIKHLRPNTRMKAKVLAWKFSPQLNEYRRQLLNFITKNLTPKGVAMEFDYVPINSQQFRERIVRKYPEASENEFFLRFTQTPIIGDIVYQKIGIRKYRFEAVDTYSSNLDGYLVNCQWDFDYQRGHFAADPDYILNRKENKGKRVKETGKKFEAVLEAGHIFPKSGQYTVACRVQDNLGGEAIKAIEIEVEA